MDFGPSEDAGRVDLLEPDQRIPGSVKILVAGGFGVGKSTLVATVSEIGPLQTEEALTDEGISVDDTSDVADKTTTTVVLDFGRITLGADLVLYLFGTPGQARFSFVQDELSSGAIGAVVLTDPRRLADSSPSIEYFERCGIPYLVAVNRFDGAPRYDAEKVRRGLNLHPGVPVTGCDARVRESSKRVLITLVEHVMSRLVVPL
jgi:signal recognition particle receptor subunit beta